MFDISDEQLEIAKGKTNDAKVNENIEGIFQGDKYPDFFNNPEYWHIYKVMKTGDLPKHEKVNQPARHFFEAVELNNLIMENGFDNIILGGSPCFSCGNLQSVEELWKDEKAFNTILQIEIETYTKPTMVDSGEFLLARGIKNQ